MTGLFVGIGVLIGWTIAVVLKSALAIFAALVASYYFDLTKLKWWISVTIIVAVYHTILVLLNLVFMMALDIPFPGMS